MLLDERCFVASSPGHLHCQFWVCGIAGMKPAEGSERLRCEFAITRDCLWQIHWPDRYVPLFGAAAYDPVNEREDVPFEEQLEALEKVVKAGKVKLCQSLKPLRFLTRYKGSLLCQCSLGRG